MKPSYLLLVGALFAGSLAANGQKDPSSDEVVKSKWLPKEVIPLNDSMALYRVWFGNDDEGIALVNKSGNVLGKEVRFPKYLLDIAIFGGKVLAFYQPEKVGEKREVRVVPVDLTTMVPGPEQVVYSVNTPFATKFTVERDPDGHFQGLLVDTRAYQAKDPDDIPEKAAHRLALATISQVNLITLTNDLQPVNKPLEGHLAGTTYIGSGMNGRGALFLTTYDGSHLVTDKYDGKGKPVAELTCPFQFKVDEQFSKFFTQVDPLSQEAFMVHATCYVDPKHLHSCPFRFDFATRKAYTGMNELLDHDYIRGLTLDTATGKKVKGFESIYEREGRALTPTQIIETPDLVILCREWDIVGNDRGFFQGSYQIGLLSVYDKQMHFIRQIILDKHIKVFEETGPCMNLHQQGNKLFALTLEELGVEKSAICIYTIDPRSGVINRRVVSKGSWSKAPFTMPGNTFWTPSGPLINYVWRVDASLMKPRVKTYFQPAEYE